MLVQVQAMVPDLVPDLVPEDPVRAVLAVLLEALVVPVTKARLVGPALAVLPATVP